MSSTNEVTLEPWEELGKKMKMEENMNWQLNTHYILDGFSAEIPLPFKRKLLCMGFTPGTEFQTIRQAPLGDPWQIKIKGTHLSMRLAELNLLRVHPK